ncbi:MAG: redoxin domain-containing protein [Deltaproteobacteria bacterium]|nr:redoxin domain-containing protein [Deltaproteobacteria bacterium]
MVRFGSAFSIAATVLAILLTTVPMAVARPVASVVGAAGIALDTELPVLINGVTGMGTIRSFLKDPGVEALVLIIETEDCDLCDRAAGSNRALANAIIKANAKLLYLVTGKPEDLGKLLENRHYERPVMFDLDGVVAGVLGTDPKLAPHYIVVDKTGRVLGTASGQTTNPAALQVTIVTALLMRRAGDPPPPPKKPATP